MREALRRRALTTVAQSIVSATRGQQRATSLSWIRCRMSEIAASPFPSSTPSLHHYPVRRYHAPTATGSLDAGIAPIRSLDHMPNPEGLERLDTAPTITGRDRYGRWICTPFRRRPDQAPVFALKKGGRRHNIWSTSA